LQTIDYLVDDLVKPQVARWWQMQSSCLSYCFFILPLL